MNAMKRSHLFAILFLLSATWVVSALALRKAYRADRRAKESMSRATEAMALASKIGPYVRMLRLARIIERPIDDSSRDSFQIAVRLRNAIYQQVPLKPTSTGFVFEDYDEAYLSAFRDESVGHICGGLAITYTIALESQGIPARYVGMFSRDRAPYDSHATVEFWHSGKWYASDPTFNVMFKSGDEYLSYAQLYDLVMNGKAYQTVSNGFPVLPERSIEGYYRKIEDLFKFIVIHPGHVWSDGKRLDYPITLLPPDWGGILTRDDGAVKDISKPGGVYLKLGKGMLR